MLELKLSAEPILGKERHCEKFISKIPGKFKFFVLFCFADKFVQQKGQSG